MNNFERTVRKFLEFDAWLGAETLGSGNINDTYRVKVAEGARPAEYILQRLNHRIFTAPRLLMENTTRVCFWLKNQAGYGLQIPEPICTKTGQLLYHDAGNEAWWRMFPFVPGAWAPDRVDTPAVAAAAAGAYGRFFRALAGFPMETLHETIPGFHDSLRRYAVFEKCVADDPAGRAAQAGREIAAVRRMAPVFEAIDRLKKNGSLPLRVTHNDTKAGNVLLDNSSHTALAVIDLDTVMPGTVLSDFGDMVRTFVPNYYEDDPDISGLVLRMEVLKALTGAYLENAGDLLTPTERANLHLGACWIAGEQTMRFLGDYLAGDVYYKIAYPEHNLIRARNQAALFEAIRQTDF